MKILYFTGTGNSLYIAKQFEKEFDAELLSIPKLFNNECYDIKADVVGIIFPIYALEIPNMVSQYLSKVNIKSEYIFAVFNHALFSFDTKLLINRYNFDLDYIAQLKMPNNFLQLFDMNKVNSKKLNYDDNINKFIEDVRQRKKLNKKSTAKFLFGNIIRKFSNENYKEADKYFYVDDRCTKCGICSKVCVSKNISVVNKVEFLHNCEQCMACIHLCPSNAIHHKKEKSNIRYKHKDVGLDEIIKSNE